MSKAFTREDGDASFVVPRAPLTRIPEGPIRLTATGARTLALHEDPHVRAAVARAEVLPPQAARPSLAALGVIVHVHTTDGEERAVRLVTAEERAMLGDGCRLVAW